MFRTKARESTKRAGRLISAPARLQGKFARSRAPRNSAAKASSPIFKAYNMGILKEGLAFETQPHPAWTAREIVNQGVRRIKLLGSAPGPRVVNRFAGAEESAPRNGARLLYVTLDGCSQEM